jgi:hypothetical protein
VSDTNRYTRTMAARPVDEDAEEHG